MKTKVYYRAEHRGQGMGHYSDLRFDTEAEARNEIRKTLEAGGADKEYRAYWKSVGEGMIVTIVTETVEDLK